MRVGVRRITSFITVQDAKFFVNRSVLSVIYQLIYARLTPMIVRFMQLFYYSLGRLFVHNLTEKFDGIKLLRINETSLILNMPEK